MRIKRFDKKLYGGRWVAVLGLITAASLTVLSATPAAHAQGAPAAAGVSRQNAAAAVARIWPAAQQLNYQGVFVYQRGTFVQSSRITHYATRDGEFEQIESLDGKPRKILRHDDDLYTFVPERHLCVVEKRQTKDAFPALLSASADQVLSVYTPTLAGTDRVAGLDAQVLELAPKDTWRFAYKLWVDPKTGLLLRSQTLDSGGTVLEQTAFSQLTVGGPADAASIANGIRSTAGWTVVRPSLQPVDMAAAGWRFPASAVPGFTKIRELRRMMASNDANAAPIPVDQAVFSDGIATLSVFVEPVAHNSRTEGAGSNGATHLLVTRRGDYWITLLGEVPQVTLQQFASAIEYNAPTR